MVSLLAAVLAAPALAQTASDLGEKALDPVEAERRGFDYWVGRGVARDAAQAAKWLEQAAAAGRPYAVGLLADLYRTRRGRASGTSSARASSIFKQPRSAWRRLKRGSATTPRFRKTRPLAIPLRRCSG